MYCTYQGYLPYMFSTVLYVQYHQQLNPMDP